MIDQLTNLETNALITVFCLSILAGIVFALAVVAFVFDQLDRRSRKRLKRGFSEYRNPPPPALPLKKNNH